MTIRSIRGRVGVALASLVLGGALLTPTIGLANLAQPPANMALAGEQAWSAARSGAGINDVLSGLRTINDADDPLLASLRASVAELDGQFQAREAMRASRIATVQSKLAELLAKPDITASISSRALRFAVEWHMLALDKAAVLADVNVAKATQTAAEQARAAENRGDWLMAAELFARLNMLYEEAATFKKDAKRLADRLAMIRLYMPKRLWDMRNERRAAEGLPVQTVFNGAGEDFNDKLRGITVPMVMAALRPSARNHVERTPMRALLMGGLEAVRTMITTHDLEEAFPGIGQEGPRNDLLAYLDRQEQELNAEPGAISDFAASAVLNNLLQANRTTVQLPEPALLHEFGNGAFSRLDDFSQIVWPDEVSRFRRMTQGSFVGVGIQIQMDDERQLIKVIAPIENAPAIKAGVRSGDLIKKIGNVSAEGLSLDQAIEQITGTPGTIVQMVFERDGQDIAFDLRRERIPLTTVKGWARTGAGDNDWNWFIDPQNRIGYLRLSGFNQSTQNSSAREVKQAIQAMQREGVRGLIFDLRFNPGGLMDQAVQIVNLFVDEGTIVYTERYGGVREQTERATPGRAIAANLPVVVLINDNSASASEIVAGALKDYSDAGKVNAIILGDRSFGKGSVQNVMGLTPSNEAEMRLTTQYYYLPGGRLVHRRDGAKDWGVIPHIKVDMLPQQVNDALLLRTEVDLPEGASRVNRQRRDADDGEVVSTVLDGPLDPYRLIREPIDLQLHTALVLLRAQVAGQVHAQAGHKNAGGPG